MQKYLRMKKIKQLLQRLKRFQYPIIITLILVYMTFFDVNSFQNHYTLNQVISKLEKQKDFYRAEIQKDSLAIHALTHSKASLEKFARETYLMKRDNEDIFIVIDDNE